VAKIRKLVVKICDTKTPLPQQGGQFGVILYQPSGYSANGGRQANLKNSFIANPSPGGDTE